MSLYPSNTPSGSKQHIGLHPSLWSCKENEIICNKNALLKVNIFIMISGTNGLKSVFSFLSENVLVNKCLPSVVMCIWVKGIYVTLRHVFLVCICTLECSEHSNLHSCLSHCSGRNQIMGFQLVPKIWVEGVGCLRGNGTNLLIQEMRNWLEWDAIKCPPRTASSLLFWYLEISGKMIHVCVGWGISPI